LPIKILAHTLKLITGALISLTTYTTTTPLTGAINKTDKKLREMPKD